MTNPIRSVLEKLFERGMSNGEDNPEWIIPITERRVVCGLIAYGLRNHY